MRVGVIRGDLPGPIFINDLEPTSQYNASTEAGGQTRYLSRPSVSHVQALINKEAPLGSAAALILATSPVGGPLNVSPAAIRAVADLGTLTDGLVTQLQDAIAPHFVETSAVISSFSVGNLAKFKLGSFNPDPTRVPAFSDGPAISCVEDNGSTVFSL
jgi:hypothetical protein